MSKIVRVEERDGETVVTVAVKMDPSKYVPPPEGWKYFGGSIAGDDGCIVEDSLCRGVDDALVLFVEAPELTRAEMTPEQAIANIVGRGHEHGISVEPGEIVTDDKRVRTGWVFRGWRVSGEGCTWKDPTFRLFTTEDGRKVCDICGQEKKPEQGTTSGDAPER